MAICLAKKVKKTTFEDIIPPIDDMDRVIDQVSHIKNDMRSLFDRYLPDFSSIPPKQGMT